MKYKFIKIGQLIQYSASYVLPNYWKYGLVISKDNSNFSIRIACMTFSRNFAIRVIHFWYEDTYMHDIKFLNEAS